MKNEKKKHLFDHNVFPVIILIPYIYKKIVCIGGCHCRYHYRYCVIVVRYISVSMRKTQMFQKHCQWKFGVCMCVFFVWIFSIEKYSNNELNWIEWMVSKEEGSKKIKTYRVFFLIVMHLKRKKSTTYSCCCCCCFHHCC